MKGLRQQRRACRLSLRALGDLCSPPLSPSMLCQVENGQRQLSSDAEARIVRALAELEREHARAAERQMIEDDYATAGRGVFYGEAL